MVNPATKNPTNLAMFRTLSAPELTLEIIASQGGQKNACAMPVPILHTMISGTVCTMESAYVDTAFRATPAVRIHPRLNLSSSIPTNRKADDKSDKSYIRMAVITAKDGNMQKINEDDVKKYTAAADKFGKA